MKYYENLLTEMRKNYIETKEEGIKTERNELKQEEVTKVIKSFKKRKLTGPEGLIYGIIHHDEMGNSIMKRKLEEGEKKDKDIGKS